MRAERWHGTSGGYTNHHCRCNDCRAAWAATTERMRQTRQAQRILIDGRLTHPYATHGTGNAYSNYGCRCSPCTEAWNAAKRRQRANARTVRKIAQQLAA